MKKFALYFDKDKEIEWLNKMSEDGYAMVDFFAGLYTFEPCEKGEWQYQIDIGNGFFNVNREYAEFMEEMGIEIVRCWGPWVVLRRRAQEGEFALYTDVDSQIEQYKKILLMFKIVTGLELLILVFEIYGGLTGIPFGWPCALIIGALICVFFNIIVRTKNILAELHERKGDPACGTRSSRISAALPAGMLLNSVNLLAADYIPTPFRVILLVAALGLIIYGAYETAAARKKLM